MIQRDRKKIIRAGIIFGIWIFLIFAMGNMLSNKAPAESKTTAQKNIEQTEVSDPKQQPKGEETTSSSTQVADIGWTDDGTPKTKAQTIADNRVKKLTKNAVKADTLNLESLLNLDNWQVVGEVEKDNIVVLKPYFPQGQNQQGWREAFVMRAFPNVKLQDPVPVVYEIYDTWLKIQLPDIKINPKEDSTGISFSGYSDRGRVFITGKVLRGSMDNIVYIIQYTIKNDNRPDVEQKAQQWNINLERIK